VRRATNEGHTITMTPEAPAPYRAVIFDFGGVLTTSLGDCARAFALSIGLPENAYAEAISVHPTGRRLYAELERGDITQQEWNTGIAALLGIDGADLMERALATLRPEPRLIEAARLIRATGMKTAVLSNSMGTSPFNPYQPWDLETHHDVVVLSERCRLRKPDPAIYELTASRLNVSTASCIFIDDMAVNLPPAQALGMATVHAQHPQATVHQLEQLLGIPLTTRPQGEAVQGASPIMG
jgi:putative hydrolase of the HAD superfamily